MGYTTIGKFTHLEELLRVIPKSMSAQSQQKLSLDHIQLLLFKFDKQQINSLHKRVITKVYNLLIYGDVPTALDICLHYIPVVVVLQ